MCGAPGRPIAPSRGLRVYNALDAALLPRPPRRRRRDARRLGLRHLRAQQPPVRPRDWPRAAAGAGGGPHVRRRAEPGRHRADPREARRPRHTGGGPSGGRGERVPRSRAVARRVAAAGHEVGNHTWRHRKLHVLGPRRTREELERAHDLITGATGVSPRSFRAPHGYRSPFVGAVTRRLGYTVFGWTFGVWDSAPRVPAEQIRARVRRKLRPGAIVLLHDGDGYDPEGDRRRTAAALPGIISDARDAGYTLRPLAELVRFPPRRSW